MSVPQCFLTYHQHPAQAANAAHHQLDADPRIAGAVQRINDGGVNQRVHFHPDCCWLSGFGKSDFLVNVV